MKSILSPSTSLKTSTDKSRSPNRSSSEEIIVDRSRSPVRHIVKESERSRSPNHSPEKELSIDDESSVLLKEAPSPAQQVPVEFMQENCREKAYAVALKIKQFLATRQLFQKTLDINDVKQRYILVRESTRKDIKEATGAEVQVLGKWVPLREYATEKVPILMLKVTADSADKLDAALRYLDVLMGQAEKMQKLTMQTMSLGGRFVDYRLEVGMENTPGFNLRGKLVGPNGSYIKHINHETGVRIQLKGRGSGFFEADGKEGPMMMFMHLTAQSNDDITRGKKLCEDLIKNVRHENDLFMEQKRALEPMMGSLVGSNSNHMMPPGMDSNSYVHPPPPGFY